MLFLLLAVARQGYSNLSGFQTAKANLTNTLELRLFWGFKLPFPNGICIVALIAENVAFLDPQRRFLRFQASRFPARSV